MPQLLWLIVRVFESEQRAVIAAAVGVLEQAFQVDVRRLLEAMHEAFSDAELRELFFAEPFDYEGLGGSKRDKIVELIGYYQRRGRLPELLGLCRQARPYRDWDG